MELLYCGEQNVCTEHDIDTNSNDITHVTQDEGQYPRYRPY